MKYLLFLLSFFYSIVNLYADTYYAKSDGDWDNTSTWDKGSIPGASDDVVVDGYLVAVQSDESCKSLLIKSDNRNDDTHLRVYSGYTLTVTNDVNVRVEDENWVDINLLVYGTLNIGGDLNYYRDNTTNNELRLYIDGGTLNVSGDFNYDYVLSESSMDEQELYITHGGILNCTNTNITQSGGGKLVIEIKYASEWNVTNNLTINRTNGNDFKYDSYHTSSINVQGDFLIDQNNCQEIYITMSQTSSINTDGDFTIDWDQSDGDDNHINIQLWDEAQINIDGTMEITMSDDESETHNLNLKVDEDSQINVGTNDGNFAEKLNLHLEAGSDLYVDLNRDAIITVYGDAYFVSDGYQAFNLRLNADLNGSSHLDIKRNCYINSNINHDWAHQRIEMDGTSNFEIGNNLEINNTSSNISYTQIYLDRDAQINIGNDFNINHSSTGSIEIFSNDDQNGDANDGQIDIGGDFAISANQIREFEINLKDGSDINVDGDFDINITGYDEDWGGLEINMASNAGIMVGDDFSINNKGTGTGINTNLTLEDNTFITIGTSSAVTSDFSIAHDALDEFKIDMANTTSINVYGDFTIDKKDNGSSDNALLYMNDDANVNVYKHLILKNSNNSNLVEIDLHDDSSVLNVRGNIDMTSAVDADRIKIHAEYASNIYIGGSFLRGDKPNRYGILNCDDEATVHYNGDGTYGQQTVAESYGDGTDAFTYQYVIINNSWNSVPQLTMEGVTEILDGRNLTFSDGIVEATSSNYFEIQDDATVSDASDNSYVDGYIHKIGDDAFTFPVGDTDNGKPDSTGDEATRYAPLVISAPSSSSTDFYCMYKNENPDAFGTDKEATLDHITKEEYWLLEPTSGTPTVNVTLSWSQPRSGDIDNTSDLRVAHWDGSIWEDYGNDATTGDNDAGTIVSDNVSSFSPFTLASVSSDNPLPVALINFKVSTDNKNVYLSWETLLEINNDYFIVERSSDGIHFEEITKIEGAGNYSQKKSYSYIDYLPYQDVSYYRLKQIDFDGQIYYSETKSVELTSIDRSLSNNDNRFLIYPNPVQDYLNIEGLDESINIEIYDISGKIIKNKDLELDHHKIDVSDLNKGVYVLRIYSTNNVCDFKLVKL